MERVMIFIDGSNFYHSLKLSFGKTKIDIAAFCKSLCPKEQILKIFYYTAPLNQQEQPKAYDSKQRFLSKIQQIDNLELFLGRLEKRPFGLKVEKGVDVKIAVDLLINAFRNNYDTAYLITNDADFVPAIQEVQKLGKKIINVTFPKTKSFHLNNISNETKQINSIEKFLLDSTSDD